MKFKYDEMELPFYKPLLQKIKEDTSIHIVHLKRRNLVKRYVSQLIAVQRNVFNVTRPRDVPPPQTVVVPPDACDRELELARRRESHFDSFFRGHPVFDLTYEGIVDDRGAVLESLQTFLGVSVTKLKVATLKVLPDNLSEIVTNYQELKNHFANTQYQEFFAPAPDRSFGS